MHHLRQLDYETGLRLFQKQDRNQQPGRSRIRRQAVGRSARDSLRECSYG
jgi:hypothetical protein